MNTHSYVVDQNQYMSAVINCNNAFQYLNMFIKTYSHKDLVKITYDQNKYYFKVLRMDNKNGFQLCVSPVNQKIVIYLIKNGIKDITQQIDIDDFDEIVRFFSNILMLDYCAKDKYAEIYENLENDIDNFKIIKNKHIISIVENNNQNGYYIYFDTDSYAKIGIIINNRYYNNNSTSVDNYLSLINNIKSMIMNDVHNKTKFYNIIDPKYIDCNLNQCNDDNFQTLNNSFDDPRIYD